MFSVHNVNVFTLHCGEADQRGVSGIERATFHWSKLQVSFRTFKNLGQIFTHAFVTFEGNSAVVWVGYDYGQLSLSGEPLLEPSRYQ